jgi:hypothetical protein
LKGVWDALVYMELGCPVDDMQCKAFVQAPFPSWLHDDPPTSERIDQDRLMC